MRNIIKPSRKEQVNHFAKNFNDTVGARIRYIRHLRGLTSKELGDHIGVTFQQINKYEKGIDNISVAKLLLVADKLEHHIDNFLKPYVESLLLQKSGYKTMERVKKSNFDQKMSENYQRLTKALMRVPSGYCTAYTDDEAIDIYNRARNLNIEIGLFNLNLDEIEQRVLEAEEDEAQADRDNRNDYNDTRGLNV